MARTSLARQLRSLAAEHRAAQELGWTPQQVHESGADVVRTELGRRGFLKGALGVAGLAALSSAGVALPAAAAGSRIAVVGAGIAGLSAALRLQDSGVASTVYEAGFRVGGRMYSNTTSWEAGQVSEWGGELIDTGHKTVQALARRFGLGGVRCSV